MEDEITVNDVIFRNALALGVPRPSVIQRARGGDNTGKDNESENAPHEGGRKHIVKGFRLLLPCSCFCRVLTFFGPVVLYIRTVPEVDIES